MSCKLPSDLLWTFCISIIIEIRLVYCRKVLVLGAVVGRASNFMIKYKKLQIISGRAIFKIMSSDINFSNFHDFELTKSNEMYEFFKKFQNNF
jgi:hypothetical protein